MDVPPEVLERYARSRARARTYVPPVDPGAIIGAGTDGQVLPVEVVAVEAILDRSLLYLRVERSVPPRYATALVDVAGTQLPGARGTATFRHRPGIKAGAWEFAPRLGENLISHT